MSLALLAPGRFSFGVGIGGEDRAEVLTCGVDPGKRGKRFDESLAIVRDLLAGQTVDHSSGFYELDQVRLLPDPPAPVPVLVGGRSQAALRRAGRLSEGFLALWTTPKQWQESVAAMESTALDAGRADVPRRHGLQLWCGITDSATKARPMVADAMESL